MVDFRSIKLWNIAPQSSEECKYGICISVIAVLERLQIHYDNDIQYQSHVSKAKKDSIESKHADKVHQ